MLYDIHSSLYDYFRGAILILSLYQLLFYVQNRNKLFLYYSLYFLLQFLFFISTEIPSNYIKQLFVNSYVTIHFLSYVVYASFAKELLSTKQEIPKWDKQVVRFQISIAICIPIAILILVLLGNEYQFYFYYFMFPFISAFAIMSYYHLLKMGTNIARLFVLGSSIYVIAANISVWLHVLDNSKYISKFFPAYIGVIIEAIIFAGLIGLRLRYLEENEIKTANLINELKKVVVKDHIILKNKTKVYISDLLYIKSEDHYLSISLNNKKNHFVRGNLKNIKEELPPNFIQCHRSYIVNQNFVKQINSESLILINKDRVPLSRSFKEKFK